MRETESGESDGGQIIRADAAFRIVDRLRRDNPDKAYRVVVYYEAGACGNDEHTAAVQVERLEGSQSQWVAVDWETLNAALVWEDLYEGHVHRVRIEVPPFVRVQLGALLGMLLGGVVGWGVGYVRVLLRIQHMAEASAEAALAEAAEAAARYDRLRELGIDIEAPEITEGFGRAADSLGHIAATQMAPTAPDTILCALIGAVVGALICVVVPAKAWWDGWYWRRKQRRDARKVRDDQRR